MGNGKVWLVGAGPSDAGLITIKGKQAIEKADVVVYDKLVGDGVLLMIPRHCEKIDVGKSSGDHPVPQEDINRILLEEANKGKQVVRLKGGDPFLFGRGGEELELLNEAGIPYEIIPGITSALAVPAYAGIPVTHRDYASSLHIITAHPKRGSGKKIDFGKLAALEGTLVFLMGAGAVGEICSGLLAAGMAKDTPAAMIEQGTSALQKSITADLNTLPEKAKSAAIKAPAVIVVGDVCRLSDKFHWKDKRLLDGARVIVTRPRQRASGLTESLMSYGAEVTALPFIDLLPLKDNEKFHRAMKQLRSYNWIIFTSEQAVNIFFDDLFEKCIDIRKLHGIKFAAVGPMTQKAIEKRGILVDYVPEKYYGEELGKGLSQIVSENEKVLLLTPKDISSDCALQLKENQILFEEIPLYETVFDEITADQVKDYEFTERDFAAFTSASTVKGFVKALNGYDFTKVQAVCIGKRTAAEADKYNMQVFTPDTVSIDAMVQLIIELYGKVRAKRESEEYRN